MKSSGRKPKTKDYEVVEPELYTLDELGNVAHATLVLATMDRWILLSDRQRAVD